MKIDNHARRLKLMAKLQLFDLASLITMHNHFKEKFGYFRSTDNADVTQYYQDLFDTSAAVIVEKTYKLYPIEEDCELPECCKK